MGMDRRSTLELPDLGFHAGLLSPPPMVHRRTAGTFGKLWMRGCTLPPQKKNIISIFLSSNTLGRPRALEVTLFLEEKALWAPCSVSGLGAEWGGRGGGGSQESLFIHWIPSVVPPQRGSVSQFRPLRDVLGGFSLIPQASPQLPVLLRLDLKSSRALRKVSAALGGTWRGPSFSSLPVLISGKVV